MRTPLLVDASARERICWRRNCHDPRALSKAKDETARSLAVAARYGRDCAADKGRETARVCRRETGRIADRRRDRVTPLTSGSSGPLVGRIRVPGDKSISHRALMLGALAVGETAISGLLEGEDVLRTAAAVRALGAHAAREAPGRWRVHGVGVGGFTAPDDVLDFGNSGTGARLLMGAVAGQPVTAVFS